MKSLLCVCETGSYSSRFFLQMYLNYQFLQETFFLSVFTKPDSLLCCDEGHHPFDQRVGSSAASAPYGCYPSTPLRNGVFGPKGGVPISFTDSQDQIAEILVQHTQIEGRQRLFHLIQNGVGFQDPIQKSTLNLILLLSNSVAEFPLTSMMLG